MKTIKGLLFTEKHTFEYGCIAVCDNRIAEVTYCAENELTDSEKAQIIIPGLIDIHMHGACGHDICSCSAEDISIIADYQRQNGITSFCPATMTLEKDRLADICRKIVSANQKAVKGIYMEGPFIAGEKAGAQNPEHVIKPDYELYQRLQEASQGLIRIITVAPEVEGAVEFIEKVSRDNSGCKVSIAHTKANAEETRKAIEAGAKHVTHLYNAMTQMSHREPGVVGEAADHQDVMVELICDGIHVDPVMVRNTFRMFGAERIILVSDSMEATGMEDGMYMLGDLPVRKLGNRAELESGTIAGSVTNLFDCMRGAISFGINPENAIAAATINPAKEIGISEAVGSLEAGKMADILVLDQEYNLKKVILGEEDMD